MSYEHLTRVRGVDPKDIVPYAMGHKAFEAASEPKEFFEDRFPSRRM